MSITVKVSDMGPLKEASLTFNKDDLVVLTGDHNTGKTFFASVVHHVLRVPAVMWNGSVIGRNDYGEAPRYVLYEFGESLMQHIARKSDHMPAAPSHVKSVIRKGSLTHAYPEGRVSVSNFDPEWNVDVYFSFWEDKIDIQISAADDGFGRDMFAGWPQHARAVPIINHHPACVYSCRPESADQEATRQSHRQISDELAERVGMEFESAWDHFTHLESEGKFPQDRGSSTARTLLRIMHPFASSPCPTGHVVVDLPEKCLHPDSQEKVVDFLGRVLKTGTGLILITHSDHILRHLNDFLDSQRDSADQVGVSAMRFRRTSDGCIAEARNVPVSTEPR